jgi:hypothetical protein
MIPFGIYIFSYQQTDVFDMQAAAKLVNLSDATNQFEVRIGFCNVFNAAPADGLYFRAQHGDTNWEAVNMDDTSNVTIADTGVAIDTNWHAFSIEHDGTTCRYYIDDVLKATQATNRPDNATNLTPGAGIFKAASTTSRSLRVDAINFDTPYASLQASRARFH